MPTTTSAGDNAAAPLSQFNFSGARAAGFTDDQIVQHLASDPLKLAGGYNVSGALQAGFTPSQIIQHLGGQAPEDTYVQSVERGAGETIGGLGKTIETHAGKNWVSDKLEQAGDYLTPQDSRPAQIVDQNGAHAANVPSALLENSPRLAAALLAAKAIPGPWWAKGLGAAAAGFLTSAGDEAQEAANNRTGQPNAPITGADVLKGDLTSAAENAASMAPSSLLLKSVGPTAGAIAALKKLGLTAAAEGAAGAAGNVAHDVAQGEKIDPTEVANAAAANAVAAAPFGARNAARETLDAVKYRDFNSPEMREAATQFANRAQQLADGRNLEGNPVYPAGAQRTGAEVFNKAADAVRGELGDAVADLRKTTTLPADADNALNAAMSGGHMTQREYGLIADAVDGHPQADNIMNLLRQTRVADIVGDTGTLSGDKFKGGFSRAVPAALNPHNLSKTGLAAMGALAFEEGGGHLIHYSPEVAGVMAGIHALSKMSDALTGAQTPMGRFVRNFADGTTPIRQTTMPVETPVTAPLNPTGPRVPQLPAPWGAPAAQTVDPRAFVQEVNALRLPLRDMRARQAAAKAAAAQAPASVAPKATPAIDPLNLPRSITTPASNLVSGIVAAQKMRAMQEGQATPKPVLSQPQLPASAAASALQKLNATEAPAVTAVSKKNDGTVQGKMEGANRKLPLAPFAHLPTEAAARQILNNRLAAKAPIDNPEAYLAKILGVLTSLRNKTQAVAAEAPNSIPAVELNRFEGIRSGRDAREYREYLKLQYPGAKAALARHFSDEAIRAQWAKQ